MRDLDKWTRAHDAGGWRYQFQCSNMVESFNKLLLGIHVVGPDREVGVISDRH